MPLKLTSFSDKGQVAALNRWADGIETQQRATENFSLFVNNGVNELMNAPAATSTSVVGPGFTNPVPDPTTYHISNMIGGAANNIGSVLFELPAQITTSHFNFNVQAGDAGSFYDWGIYGPVTPTTASIPLLCHTGSQQFVGVGSTSVAWLTPVKLEPGYYFIAITSDGAPPGLQVYGGFAISWLYGSLVSTVSTGAGITLSLPGNITVQALSPVSQTSGAGLGQPQDIVFNLY